MMKAQTKVLDIPTFRVWGFLSPLEEPNSDYRHEGNIHIKVYRINMLVTLQVKM